MCYNTGMGKWETNKKLKLESLLNTSFELFTTKGISKTSISDIVEKAGVAKGTFYLYFKDKLDIRDRLILHKSSQLFEVAYHALMEEDIPDFADKLIFMADHILDSLNADKPLLTLLYKDLSWGVFKRTANEKESEGVINFVSLYHQMINESGLTFRDPEIMLFQIVELLGSAGYSSIIYSDPVDIEHLKPHLAVTIRNIIREYTVDGDDNNAISTS